MGLNPFRQQDHSVLDIIAVALAVLVTLALVAWGLFGG